MASLVPGFMSFAASAVTRDEGKILTKSFRPDLSSSPPNLYGSPDMTSSSTSIECACAEAPTLPGSAATMKTNETKKIKVLIVEDQRLMRQLLREFMQTAHPDFVILEADTGERALKVCDTDRPQLVLLDVQLPDANGIALTSQIKAIVPDALVLIVSQHWGHTYIERALAAGAFAYIMKERVYRELLPTIDSALRSRRANRSRGDETATAQPKASPKGIHCPVDDGRDR
jgi:PleD family two-component response regulator